ncbi:MAG: peptidylprolyl isomerase SurA, partial [Aliivibrio sp.]|nr:peptidylprolyl isomerase SurA [Aliivibrio sp.]
MKNWKSPIFSALLIIVSSAVSSEPVELDSVVAVVNDGVVLKSDIDTAIKTVKINAEQKGQPLPELDVLREQVIEKLI